MVLLMSLVLVLVVEVGMLVLLRGLLWKERVWVLLLPEGALGYWSWSWSWRLLLLSMGRRGRRRGLSFGLGWSECLETWLTEC